MQVSLNIHQIQNHKYFDSKKKRFIVKQKVKLIVYIMSIMIICTCGCINVTDSITVSSILIIWSGFSFLSKIKMLLLNNWKKRI